MRTVPILAGGILLTLVLGTATAVAASSESTRAEVERVTVAAAAEPTITAEPVVVAAPTATTEPTLTWSAPTAQPAPEPAELELAPGYEVPTFEPIGELDASEQGSSAFPAEPDARCTDVVPQRFIDAMQAEGSPLYGIVAPDPTYFPWEGYPLAEVQIMSDHWLTNCTWVNTLGEIRHVDFGAGLDAADLSYLDAQVTGASWVATPLSTGATLHVDTALQGDQFPETQAWLIDGDRWMRIHMVNDTDAAAFAEGLLASGLTWP